MNVHNMQCTGWGQSHKNQTGLSMESVMKLLFLKWVGVANLLSLKKGWGCSFLAFEDVKFVITKKMTAP